MKPTPTDQPPTMFCDTLYGMGYHYNFCDKIITDKVMHKRYQMIYNNKVTSIVVVFDFRNWKDNYVDVWMYDENRNKYITKVKNLTRIQEVHQLIKYCIDEMKAKIRCRK